ncbi:MAG: histidine phosphatase family protein [Pseudomonadales bacterium]
MSNSTRLGLVRHGQTYANISRVWHGHTDTELTEEGYEQARKLGVHFHNYMQPTVIVASPLQRARITAENIAAQFELEVTLDSRLMEFSLGDWEDKSFDTLGAPGEDVMRQLVEDPDYATPNGESQNLVKDRFVTALDEIVARHSGETIVVVAHGVALGIALAHLIDNDTRRWTHYSKKNTAFSEYCLATKSLLSFNQTDHLNT